MPAIKPAVILVVEDNQTDVLLLRRAFTKTGVDSAVHTVGDGDEAVAYLAGQGAYADRDAHPFPDIVLLDLKLPKRTGLEVLDWLRSQASLKRVPAIMLTSSRDHGDVNRAYDLGANSYLVKPVSFDDLVEMVRAVNGYWAGWNEAPETRVG
jgi:CheY-like chemotaxis protein